MKKQLILTLVLALTLLATAGQSGSMSTPPGEAHAQAITAPVPGLPARQAEPAGTSAANEIYYVDYELPSDCAGNYSIANRSCTGTDGTAFNNLYDANLAVTAGDTVYIRGGTYNIGALDTPQEGIHPHHSGSQGNPITYAVYPGEQVTFYGSTWNAVAILIADKDWIKVTGSDGTPSSGMNLRFFSFDQGFLLIQSEHKNQDGSWDGTGGSNYNEISYCEFGYDKYQTYTEWQPNHDYKVGDMVVPLAKKNYLRYTLTTGPGTSGSTEPTWNDNPHTTTNDGGLVWTSSAGMGWRGSTIYRSSSYNWIHHCSFHDFGFYGLVYDGGALFELGWDQCGQFADCKDTTSNNVIENNSFYHGGHHTFGLMQYYNVIRNNVLHNEQYFNRAGDNLWHAYRNFAIAGTIGPYKAKHGYNLLEGNKVSHGSENVNNSRGGDAIPIMQDNDIIRYNEVYAANATGFSTPIHPYTEVKNTKVYNSTFAP